MLLLKKIKNQEKNDGLKSMNTLDLSMNFFLRKIDEQMSVSFMRNIQFDLIFKYFDVTAKGKY